MSRLKMRNREEEEGAERGMPHTSAHLWQKSTTSAVLAKKKNWPSFKPSFIFMFLRLLTLTSIPFSTHDMRHTCGAKVCR